MAALLDRVWQDTLSGWNAGARALIIGILAALGVVVPRGIALRSLTPISLGATVAMMAIAQSAGSLAVAGRIDRTAI